MRIIIELSEAEKGAVAIREAQAGGTEPRAASSGAAVDAGPPPEALLLALGVPAAEAARPGAASREDAGAPPAWLVDVITGAAAG